MQAPQINPNDIDDKVVIASLKTQISGLSEQIAMRDALINKQLKTINDLKSKIPEVNTKDKSKDK